MLIQRIAGSLLIVPSWHFKLLGLSNVPGSAGVLAGNSFKIAAVVAHGLMI
jgi:hypothetical protein